MGRLLKLLRAQPRPAPTGPNLLTGLAAWWGFDNAVTDSSGHGSDLTTGTPTYSNSAFFKKLGAFALSSVSAAVSRTWGGALTLANTDLTLAAWVSHNNASNGTGAFTGWSGVFEVGWMYSGSARAAAAVDGTVVNTLVNAGYDLPSRTPALVVLTWAAATGAWEFWYGGAKKETGTAVSSSALSGTFTSKRTVSAGPGALDDTGVWLRKLSDEECGLLYNGGAGVNPTA